MNDQYSSDSLGGLLPNSQRGILSESNRKLTKEDLEKVSRGEMHLSDEDVRQLLDLAVVRVNKGETIFTYSQMNLNTEHNGGGNPQW